MFYWNSLSQIKLVLAVLLVAFILFSFLFHSVTVFGHGSRASYEVVVGEYLIDVGYEPESIEAGTSALLDFSLSEQDSGLETEFSYVWLRIVKDDVTFFASGINKQKIGGAGVLYVFPEGGLYEISVRFDGEDSVLAETTFPLEVSKAAESKNNGPRNIQLILAGVIGILIGVTGAVVFHRRRVGTEA